MTIVQHAHPPLGRIDGKPRGMDHNHHVLGDTLCVCSGIADCHAAPGGNGGCDYCPCEEFEAVNE